MRARGNEPPVPGLSIEGRQQLLGPDTQTGSAPTSGCGRRESWGLIALLADLGCWEGQPQEKGAWGGWGLEGSGGNLEKRSPELDSDLLRVPSQP